MYQPGPAAISYSHFSSRRDLSHHIVITDALPVREMPRPHGITTTDITGR
jgi:hypothetical protein